MACAAILSLAVAGLPTVAEAQLVEVVSNNRSGSPNVRLSHFPAAAEVEVTFIRSFAGEDVRSFSSTARYRTDMSGAADLTNAPLSGDWTASLPEAPFWAMHPDPQAPLLPEGVVLIRARSGEIEGQAEYRLPAAPAVTSEAVDDFPGAFLVRPAGVTGPLPLVIVLGGSEGDDHTARYIAPRLAAEGFAALGLPYRSPDRGRGQALPGLPDWFSEIPVDRLERVRDWASSDRRIDPERIGLWGVSKGGEFAILAAAHYPWLDAVAAVVPSDVVWEGFGSGNIERTGTPSFSIHGRPLPFVPYGAPGRRRDAKDTGRRQNPDRAAAARIPVERFPGALLVAGSEQDAIWDSAGMSQAIAERRAEFGRPTVSLIFPDAGHFLIGDALDPAEPGGGGTSEGNGRARLSVWQATIRLFRSAWGW